ncbi:MAG: sugar transferase, partial [Arcobacteraceae bacterium]|nr:sugar transferase [Arcobacteraceae bacterium]
IIYKDKEASEVISQIEEQLKNGFTTIVLNTKVKVDDEIIKYLTNLKFKHSKFRIISIEHFLEKYLYKCYIPEDNDDLHYLDDIQGYSFFQKIQKKIVDIIAMFFLFIFFFIVKYFVKNRIDEDSPGSLYFKQLRVGLGNKEFECIKFRSMHEHNSNDDIRTATKDDDRIFKFGKTMRKTRIDELPQVLNILKGELSLIGPRAEWNKLTLNYERDIPYYNQRHIVTPGITGWAQVMFAEGRGEDDTREKLMYDLYYIKHWSLWLELKVVWMTIMVVLGKKGI